MTDQATLTEGELECYDILNNQIVSDALGPAKCVASRTALRAMLNAVKRLDSALRDERQARERAEGEAKQRVAQGPDKTLRCAFCGEAYPPDTPPSHAQALTDHVRVCPKHPMRALEQNFDSYMRSLAESVGVDMDEFDLPADHGNDRLRWACLIGLKLNEQRAELARLRGVERAAKRASVLCDQQFCQCEGEGRCEFCDVRRILTAALTAPATPDAAESKEEA